MDEDIAVNLGQLGDGLKYASLADSLRRTILAGAWPMGSKLPPERDLVESTGLSMTTVRKAYQQLWEEGLIERRRGAGTFVTQWRMKPADNSISVGILTPEIESYFGHIVRGAQDHLTSVGAGTALVATYQWDIGREKTAIERLLDGGVDGIIMAPIMKDEKQIQRSLERVNKIDVPVVLVERSPRWMGPLGRMEHVASDHVGGAFDAIEYLHRLGHEKIGLIYREGAFTSNAVFEGYSFACKHFQMDPWIYKLPAKDPHVPHPPSVIEPAAAGLAESGCSAVLVFGDREATVVQTRLMAAGVQVPQQMSIISYDDETAALAPIPLTAIAPAKYQLGKLAARNLLRRIRHGGEIPIEQTYLRPVLKVRGSTAQKQPRHRPNGV